MGTLRLKITNNWTLTKAMQWRDQPASTVTPAASLIFQNHCYNLRLRKGGRSQYNRHCWTFGYHGVGVLYLSCKIQIYNFFESILLYHDAVLKENSLFLHYRMGKKLQDVQQTLVVGEMTLLPFVRARQPPKAKAILMSIMQSSTSSKRYFQGGCLLHGRIWK